MFFGNFHHFLFFRLMSELTKKEERIQEKDLMGKILHRQLGFVLDRRRLGLEGG